MELIWSQWAVLALLVFALFTNLRSGRIANWLVLAFVAVYIARVAETGAWDSVLWQALFALGVFVLGLIMYFANLCSAGGAKLMGAVGLFLPAQNWLWLFGMFILAMILSGLIIMTARRMAGSDDSGWHVMRHNVLPMALPIALTTLIAFVWT